MYQKQVKVMTLYYKGLVAKGSRVHCYCGPWKAEICDRGALIQTIIIVNVCQKLFLLLLTSIFKKICRKQSLTHFSLFKQLLFVQLPSHSGIKRAKSWAQESKQAEQLELSHVWPKKLQSFKLDREWDWWSCVKVTSTAATPEPKNRLKGMVLQRHVYIILLH